MTARRVTAVLASACVLALTSSATRAEDRDETPASISVAFGAGLNTALPNNTPNHHIIPQEFRVKITKARKLDGTVVFVPATVNFIVSGYHIIWAYNPGVRLRDVQTYANANPGPLVNYDVNVYAKGVDPGTPPAFADASVNPSGVMNRTDSIGFAVPGRYLVICNVRGHFLDGMYAWVTVVDDDHDRHDHNDDHDDDRH